MEKLLEADFLTVNLSTIIKSSMAADNGTVDTNNATQNNGEITNWSENLKQRLEVNKKLNVDVRKTDYTIESEFFKEYFNANWSTNCAKQLMSIGGPLREAIKILGFDKEKNPILAFISDSEFVIPKLIETKLLNETTFKAIYNAVAKKYIAQSQMLKANDYNIIYCPDLYNRSDKEMLDYLRLQSKILLVNINKYTKMDLANNKKIFLELPNINGKNFSDRLSNIKSADVTNLSVQNLKLNNFDLASELKDKLGITNQRKIAADTSNAKLQQFIQNFDTPAKKLAAIQFISMTTNNAKANEALTSTKFTDVPMEKLMHATSQVAQYMSKQVLSKKMAEAIVDALLNN